MSEYREKCLSEKGRECHVCGVQNGIVAHHLDGDRTNNDLENLLPLCHKHHAAVHAGDEGVIDLVEQLDEGYRNEYDLQVTTVRLPGWVLEHFDNVAAERGINRTKAMRRTLKDVAGGREQKRYPPSDEEPGTELLKRQLRQKDKQIQSLIDKL